MKENLIADVYPLSPTQQGILYHALQAPESMFYVGRVSYELHGALDVAALKRTWERTFERHKVLRTAFVWQRAGAPLQVVQRRLELPWREFDFADLDAAEQERRLRPLLLEDRKRTSQIHRAPLMRFLLIRSTAGYRFIWTLHHLLLDGWSMSLLSSEVFALYEGLCRGKEPSLPRVPSYSDYIAWLGRQDPKHTEAYWRRALAGFTAPTPVGTRLPSVRSPNRKFDYAQQDTRLPAPTASAVRALGRRQELTGNTVLQAAWALLLSRYSRHRDVLFGAVSSGRPVSLPGSQSMVGLFVNTLPVRVLLPPGARVLPWLKVQQSQQLERQQYEHTPLVDIQGWSEVARGRSLFQTLLNFENFPANQAAAQANAADRPRRAGGLTIGRSQSVERTHYPLALDIRLDNELTYRITYDQNRFDRTLIGRLSGHFRTLLEGMLVADSACRLAEVPMLTPSECHQLSVEWNARGRELGPGESLVRIFEAQVERTPDAVAVVHGGRHWTYRELDRCAGRLAAHLVTNGVGADVVVALLTVRGFDFLASMIAGWKAGGAYLPLDPAHPPRRLCQVLRRSAASVVLAGDGFDETLSAALAHLPAVARPRALAIEDLLRRPAGADTAAFPAPSPDHLAYVIFTSGSTGVPKGAMLSHRGMLNHLMAKVEDLALTASDILAQNASQCFDISVWQFLAPLLLGGRVQIIPDETARDPWRLFVEIEAARTTILELVPSLLGPWLDEARPSTAARPRLPALRWLIATGEALPPQLARRWLRRFPQVPMMNAYGPTECSDDVTHHSLARSPAAEDLRVPIGRPVRNTRIHVLDGGLGPAAVEVAGELYVSGTGVGRGYLGDPERTAQVFIPEPFSCRPGSRLYRTGDLACYLNGGEIEFLERVDHQVKIRGFRIELGEIETALGAHPAVRECVVQVSTAAGGDAAKGQNGGDPRIVAYVVGTAESPPAVDELYGFLKARLPGYMLPAAYLTLPDLPRTPSGKVDRAALAAAAGLASPPAGKDYSAPRNPEELQLVQMWEELLEHRPVGVTDNFFELGGHSLLAVRMVARIRKHFDLDLPLSILIEGATIERLAEIIQSREVELSDSPLVALQASGTKPPLFLIQPIGGAVLCFMDLARHLGPEQPLYAFQAQEPSQIGSDHASIEETAAEYVAAVTALQSEGSYRLGGWSSGGVVAFEMARQLRRQGREVALLAILDTWWPQELKKAMPENDALLLAALVNDWARQAGSQWRLSVKDLKEIRPEDQLAHVSAELKKSKLRSADLGPEGLSRFLQGVKAREQALWNYQPDPYPGEVTMFLTREHDPEIMAMDLKLDFQDPTHGWKKQCIRPIRVLEVPGHHSTMVFEPHVETLAQSLESCLDASSEIRPEKKEAGSR